MNIEHDCLVVITRTPALFLAVYNEGICWHAIAKIVAIYSSQTNDELSSRILECQQCSHQVRQILNSCQQMSVDSKDIQNSDLETFQVMIHNLNNTFHHSTNITYGQVFNGGLGGAPSTYMEVCNKMHIPSNVDVIITEFNVNDDPNPSPPMDNIARRSYERMLRKLLKYPNKPAVIVMNSFRWFKAMSGTVSVFSHVWGVMCDADVLLAIRSMTFDDLWSFPSSDLLNQPCLVHSIWNHSVRFPKRDLLKLQLWL